MRVLDLVIHGFQPGFGPDRERRTARAAVHRGTTGGACAARRPLRAIGMSKSTTLTTTHSTVLMIVRLPGLPVTRTTLPSLATIVGVCELSIRLPGAIRFGSVPMRAVAVGDAGPPVEVHHLVVEQEAGAA